MTGKTLVYCVSSSRYNNSYSRSLPLPATLKSTYRRANYTAQREGAANELLRAAWCNDFQCSGRRNHFQIHSFVSSSTPMLLEMAQRVVCHRASPLLLQQPEWRDVIRVQRPKLRTSVCHHWSLSRPTSTERFSNFFSPASQRSFMRLFFRSI